MGTRPRRRLDKDVDSKTLPAPSSAQTRIEGRFGAAAVRRMESTSPTDLGVGGVELGGRDLGVGPVGECHLLLWPVVVGGGTRSLPDQVGLDLKLFGRRRFGNGVLRLCHLYPIRTSVGRTGRPTW
jgi:hypothetical protein